jgi:hypothetical protein
MTVTDLPSALLAADAALELPAAALPAPIARWAATLPGAVVTELPCPAPHPAWRLFLIDAPTVAHYTVVYGPGETDLTGVANHTADDALADARTKTRNSMWRRVADGDDR